MRIRYVPASPQYSRCHVNSDSSVISCGGVVGGRCSQTRLCFPLASDPSSTLEMDNVGTRSWGVGRVAPFAIELQRKPGPSTRKMCPTFGGVPTVAFG